MLNNHVPDNEMYKNFWPSSQGNVERNQGLVRSLAMLEPFFVRKLPLWKRAMDIAGAIFGLIVFSPVLLLTSILIKIVSPGPVIFKQERVGYGGKPFMIWKFRTMEADADASMHQMHIQNLLKNGVPMEKLGNDPRIIPFGHAMRISAIDELPQLLNVLRGEMSLVGPRPDVVYAVKDYPSWHFARFNSVPGLTGLWQVSGKNNKTYLEMMRLDLAYDSNRSFWLDLKIILLTVPSIIGYIKED